MTKQIKFNRSNKDFDMYLDGSYVGSRASHTEAEIDLDEMVLNALTHGNPEYAESIDLTRIALGGISIADRRFALMMSGFETEW